MSTVFLTDNIDGVRIPQSQLGYICDTSHTSHTRLVKLCSDVNYMWWGNQDLEPQEWEDCIQFKKTTILAIIRLVPNNNTPG